MTPRLDLVAGARPNFMKLAPVVKALASRGDTDYRIVHTGQHYAPSMTDVFFQELGIPRPDFHLEVGSGSHGVPTARLLERYEAHLQAHRPPGAADSGAVHSTVA
nr:UDP-N-acetylglucosamine 2-epimerase [Gemmatimonadales bacterium]